MPNILLTIFLSSLLIGCSSSNYSATQYYTTKHGISSETIAKNGYSNSVAFDFASNIIANSSEIIGSIKKHNEKYNAELELEEINNKFYENGYNVYGYDKDGYNREGFDKNGLDKQGLDKNNFDKNGINSITNSRYNTFGYDKEGFDNEGYSRSGYNKNGNDKHNKNIEQNIQIPKEYLNNKSYVGEYEGNNLPNDDNINCQNARIKIQITEKELIGKLHVENGPSLTITGSISKNKIFGYVQQGILVLGGIEGEIENKKINALWINNKCKTKLVLDLL